MRTTAVLSSVLFMGLVACGSDEGFHDAPIGEASFAATTLTEVTGFGTNPGGLKLYQYVPAGVAKGAPLVLVFHGCTQGATDATRFGWSELAEQHKFVVGYVEQPTTNNPLRCFNWAGEYGDPANVQRGKGENLSIKQMVDKLVESHGVDTKRVFAVGFSAGGAEAVLAAATWPEVFAGAASVAGVPFNCTTVYAEVSGCQKPGKDFTPEAWGDRVRAAHPGFAGPYPRMSVWQGSADGVVGPGNRTQIVKQWTNVHGLAQAGVADTVDGHKHEVWKSASGVTMVETYEIAGMDHAYPIAAGCGTAGAYVADKGICATKRVADFFGIAGGPSPIPSDGGTASGDGGKSSPSPSPSGSASGTPKGASATDDPIAERAGSTCSMHAPGSTSGASGAFGALLVGGLVAAVRRARRARREGWAR